MPSRRIPASFRARRVLACGLLAASAAAVAPSAAAADVTLRSGHVDAVGARIVAGKLRLLVKDATSRRVVWRDPNTVTLAVGDRARVRLPANGSLGFLGRPGSIVWAIPQTQRAGVLWAGWNTEEVSSRQVRSLSWRLARVSGPGRVSIFQTGAFGRPSVIFDSTRTPQTRPFPLGVHAHANWVFTRPGSYRMTFRIAGTSRSGRRLESTRALRFRVG